MNNDTSLDMPNKVQRTVAYPQHQSQTLDSEDRSMLLSNHSQPASPRDDTDGTVSGNAKASLHLSPTRKAPGRTAWQVPKKAGRPVEYQGDINNPLLSQTDRTRIKRRIVNRKAARRLRERHQETLQHAQHKVTELRQRNRKLKQGLHDRRVLRKELQGELLQAESQWSQVAADRQQLQAEVHAMRHSLEVGLMLLEEPHQIPKPGPSGTGPYMPPASRHAGSPALSSGSHEVQQPFQMDSFTPSLTARSPARECLPSQWTASSPLAGCFPEGTIKWAGQLPKGPPQRTSSLSNGCLIRAGLFPVSGALPDPGQSSVESRRSGSSMASSSCLADSVRGSATLRDYLLINDSCHEAVSSVHCSALSPSPAARTSSSPARRVSQLQRRVACSSTPYANWLPQNSINADPTVPVPWYQAQNQLQSL